MDVTTLFAIVVFGTAWFFWRRTDPEEPLVRLFLGTLMAMGAGVGILSLVLRLTQ